MKVSEIRRVMARRSATGNDAVTFADLLNAATDDVSTPEQLEERAKGLAELDAARDAQIAAAPGAVTPATGPIDYKQLAAAIVQAQAAASTTPTP